MPTKSDLEFDLQCYEELAAQARTALEAGQLSDAIHYAVESWPYVDGMMQYERKFHERQFASVETIEIVLRYAPALFDSVALNSLSDLLQAKKRIDKHATDDLAEKVAIARDQVRAALRMWRHLEKNAGCRLDGLCSVLGGDGAWWQWLSEIWERQGFLRREHTADAIRLTLLTNFDEAVKGKCPACGATARGKKHRFWEPTSCPKCRAAVYFVILNGDSMSR